MAATQGVGDVMGGPKAKTGLAAKAYVWEIYIFQTECVIGLGIGQSSRHLCWSLHRNREHRVGREITQDSRGTQEDLATWKHRPGVR